MPAHKDASAPLPISGARTARMIPNCKLIVYRGALHGIVLTRRQRFLSDLLAFPLMREDKRHRPALFPARGQWIPFLYVSAIDDADCSEPIQRLSRRIVVCCGWH